MDSVDAERATHPLDALTSSQRALLRIVCWVAWADGEFALEERELLETLVSRLLQREPDQAMAEAAVRELAMNQIQPLDLEALVAALDGADDRKLVVKLALQMVSVSQAAADAAPINAAEKQAYRRLIEALALPEAELQEAEWAARQELDHKRTLWEVLAGALDRFGAWPAAEELDPRLPMGYWL